MDRITQRIFTSKWLLWLVLLLAGAVPALAQGGASATARMDAAQITVGDQARLFIEVHSTQAAARLQWAEIPDTFNHLEVVEKGKIDTLAQGGSVTYRQRLLITGFDSGAFTVPAFVFSTIPASGTPYTVQTDSFRLAVNTVAVDTTKAFKPVKGIIAVKSTWRDYVLYALGALFIIGLVIFITIYFLRHKKVKPVAAGPVETLQEQTLRLLGELEAKNLWQKNQVKQYYIELTDIVRNYIELRFSTPAMELTTDELLYKMQLHRELQPYQQQVGAILHTADLAKFAKAQPLPQEHTGTLEAARQFINSSKPVITETPTEQAI